MHAPPFLESLKARATEQSAPEFWKEDIRQALHSFEHSIKHKEFFIPFDIQGSETDRLGIFQDYLGKFGRLLLYWPAMVSAAKDMRTAGKTLAQKI